MKELLEGYILEKHELQRQLGTTLVLLRLLMEELEQTEMAWSLDELNDVRGADVKIENGDISVTT